jgi:GWxTD domain-containing protein
MLFPLIAALTVLVTPPGGTSCIDPATPLSTLALDYTAWPTPRSDKAQEAFAMLRKFLETGNAGAYRSAVNQYERLKKENRSDLHTQLALGILYVSGPDLNPEGSTGYRRRLMSHSALADDRAARALGTVIDHDPSAWLAAVAVTRVAVATHENGRLRQATVVVAKALKASPANSALQLAWMDLLIAQGRAAEALAFSTAHPQACTAAMHVRSEALMLTGDTAAGAALYFKALEDAAPEELSRFEEDAQVIFSTGEPARYNAVPASGRRAWLQTFWARSAALSGITVQSRIAQHVQRVAYADKHYQKETQRPNGLANAVASADANDPSLTDAERERIYQEGIADRIIMTTDRLSKVIWDDRGLVYVRQGAPDTAIQTKVGSGTRIPRNETWIYDRDRPAWLFSFTRYEGPDYIFTPTMGCGQSGPTATLAHQGTAVARGGQTLRRAGGMSGAMEARDFYLELGQYDPRFDDLGKYCGLRSVGGGSPLQFRAAAMKIMQIYEPLYSMATHTESAPMHFRKLLRMMTAAYSFRGAAGATEVTALSWIPTPELRDSIPVERLRLTYTFVDTVGAPLRHDTVVAVPPISSAGLLRTATTWKNVQLTGGRLLVVAYDDGDRSRGVQRRKSITVPRLSASAAISDIVVGEPDAAGLLVRGTYRISPLPSHAITSGSEFRVFFELYGVAEGADLQTSIKVVRTERKSIAELLRLYPGRREQREVSFGSKAHLDERGIAVQDVAVGGDLLPGAYAIDVSITTPAGVLTRNTTLQVDPPKK